MNPVPNSVQQPSVSANGKSPNGKVVLDPEFADLEELLAARNGSEKGLTHKVSLEVAYEKGVFPYECYQKVEQLYTTEFPAYEKFYSSIKQATISLDEYNQATQLFEFRIRSRAEVVHHKGPLLASRFDRSLLGTPQTSHTGEHQAHQHALRTPKRAPHLVKGDHTQISENLCKSLSFPPQHRANGEKQDLQIEHQRDVFEVHDVVAETLSHLVHILRVAVLDLAP